MTPDDRGQSGPRHTHGRVPPPAFTSGCFAPGKTSDRSFASAPQGKRGGLSTRTRGWPADRRCGGVLVNCSSRARGIDRRALPAALAALWRQVPQRGYVNVTFKNSTSAELRSTDHLHVRRRQHHASHRRDRRHSGHDRDRMPATCRAWKIGPDDGRRSTKAHDGSPHRRVTSDREPCTMERPACSSSSMVRSI